MALLHPKERRALEDTALTKGNLKGMSACLPVREKQIIMRYIQGKDAVEVT